jgi:formylglycine-generating enzyme required for sulfatase activity
MTEEEARHARVQRIFEQASALIGSEREAFLEEACAGDGALLREVVELLAMDEDTGDPGIGVRLPWLAVVDIDRLLERFSAHRPPESRYRVGAEVARGGMGTIFHARDVDLCRDLAMKVVLDRSAVGDPPSSMLARFIEEAQVTGQLEHPGVVPVHELGVDEQGRLYFTMRLIRGCDLREVLQLVRERRDGWTRMRALDVILRVCETMAFAHSKGVIHRDLKPGNVMVGRFGEVYVMDWGLAKVTASGGPAASSPGAVQEASIVRVDLGGGLDREASDTPVTLVGTVMGTPAYMPPEQARGELHRVDHRADIYALGAILYHLVTGEMPYAAGTSGNTRDSVLARVVAGPPARVRELAKDVATELEAICEKAMAREPDERYAAMEDVANDLRAYMENRVVQAHATGGWIEARKWVQRNSALAYALASALALLVIGLVVSILLYHRSEGETAKVLRLADVKRLQELEAQADRLWPPYPEQIADMRSWLGRAQQLVSKLDLHRDRLVSMRMKALDAGIEELGSTEDVLRTWRFATKEEQWQHDVLVELIVDLERLGRSLEADEGTAIGGEWGVGRRLAFALELERSFAAGGSDTVAWEQALPAIREAYAGLDIPPQMGLRPIGPDPASGLWEFAHLMTGEPAERDGEGRLILTERTGVVLVLVPGGSFWMGASDEPGSRNYDPAAQADEGPLHQVDLSPFFISKYEMTQGQWKRFVGSNPSYYGPDGSWDPAWLRSHSAPSLLLPVDSVSSETCLTWLPRMGLSLPSEAQWEYAARAGSDTPWWTGRDKETLAGAANLADEYAQRHGAGEWIGNEAWDDGATVAAPIGTYAANAFGLHEVHGNLWEWCLDCYDPAFYYASSRLDPVAPCNGTTSRVPRGGSFRLAASYARSANRPGTTPTYAGYTIGIRAARPIER